MVLGLGILSGPFTTDRPLVEIQRRGAARGLEVLR